MMASKTHHPRKRGHSDVGGISKEGVLQHCTRQVSTWPLTLPRASGPQVTPHGKTSRRSVTGLVILCTSRSDLAAYNLRMRDQVSQLWAPSNERSSWGDPRQCQTTRTITPLHVVRLAVVSDRPINEGIIMVMLYLPRLLPTTTWPGIKYSFGCENKDVHRKRLLSSKKRHCWFGERMAFT